MGNKGIVATAGSVRSSLNLVIVAVLASGAVFGATEAAARDNGEDAHGGWGGQRWTCSKTTQVAYQACGHDVKDNYLVAQAKCLNVTDTTEKATCLADAKSTRRDDTTRCGDVRDARSQVCSALTIGAGPYDPPIDSINWVAADQIVGNEYFPLKEGTNWVYENTDDETITVTVTHKTAEILGIPVRVVTDVVVDSEGNKIEDTIDWYAQDSDGNVWYMGESTMATDPENMLINVDGAWETGVEGAKPGIIMPAAFTVPDVYRQEFLLGDAEDMAENLSMTATESTPVVSCLGDCRETHEYSPLEPDKSESKFYAPGVGVIVTLDDNNPTFREQLVTFTPGS